MHPVNNDSTRISPLEYDQNILTVRIRRGTRVRMRAVDIWVPRYVFYEARLLLCKHDVGLMYFVMGMNGQKKNMTKMVNILLHCTAHLTRNQI